MLFGSLQAALQFQGIRLAFCRQCHPLFELEDDWVPSDSDGEDAPLVTGGLPPARLVPACARRHTCTLENMCIRMQKLGMRVRAFSWFWRAYVRRR